jgi:superfamily II DNA or RNA helicase
MENNKQIPLPKSEQEFTIKHQKVLPYAVKQLKNVYTKSQYKDYLVDLCKSNGSNLLVLEQMLVHRSEKRMKLLIELLQTIHKNTIVFAHHTEYLRYVYDRLKVEFPDRNIYLITGSTNVKSRDKIKESLLHDENGILVASYGCLSTGITLKNLDYGIMFQSFKSQIINKQSLGRGLGLSDDKKCFYLYDFIDCFPTKKLYMQGIAKVKLYKDEKYSIHLLNF